MNIRQLSRNRAFGFVLVALLAGCLPGAFGNTRPAVQPNIIFILADDLGYGDLGSFGQQKIRTPNLDRMAAEGMRFTQHYSGCAVCAPSRCVLMTGQHPGRGFIRSNYEIKPEGQMPIPAGTLTLPKLLQKRGYTTGAFGKWGLGFPGSEGDPLKQGFDRFYGFNCQRQAHNYYPAYLWDNDRRVPLNNPDYSAHQPLPEGANAHDPQSYAGFTGKDYAPDLIAEQARQFIRQHKDRPFFLYFPTTVPHLALQVPEDSLAEYAGKWREEPYRGDQDYLPHRTPLAAYAAMITRLDREIGRLMDLVQELGLEERTVFVFTSDNGPVVNQRGGAQTDFFRSAGSLTGRKASLHEGGIRVPLIVRWPGRIKPSIRCDRVTGFEDWLPTLLELAGGKPLVPKNLDGISFAPVLMGQQLPDRPFLYREYAGAGGSQSLRMGNWKALRAPLFPTKNKPAPSMTLKLYDLSNDPTEENDLSSKHPELVAAFDRLLRTQHTPSKAFPMGLLDSASATPGSPP